MDLNGGRYMYKHKPFRLWVNPGDTVIFINDRGDEETVKVQEKGYFDFMDKFGLKKSSDNIFTPIKQK